MILSVFISTFIVDDPVVDEGVKVPVFVPESQVTPVPETLLILSAEPFSVIENDTGE